MTFINNGRFEKFPNKVWLASPTMHDGAEMKYVKEAYDTNWMSTVGANINEVEKVAAEKSEVKYAVALSCCTAALHLCVKFAGEKLYGKPEIGHGAVEGKRVFCSDMTFDATLNPVVYEGGIPVFIDTEKDSWNMDPVALEKAFEMYPEVKLVVSAELYGFSGDIKKIKEICEKHGALLIEDAAEAMGATWDGKQCGSYGDYAAVSYNGNKIITGSSGVIPCLILAKKYNISVMLAPRGELCSGAFKKKYKKLPYIAFLKAFNLLKNVYFQATSDEESEAIKRILDADKEKVHFMTNIPSIPKDRNIYVDKKEGQAKLIFISRIVPKKNLHVALDFLKNVKGKVTFDIYGSLEDEQYWFECRKKIAELPENIKVVYKGSVSHDEVHETFKRYDAFLFPTLSENFGHVIAEALMVGCPVIISDQTPWTDVNNIEGGWSIALENSKKFVEAIQIIVNASPQEEHKYKENILKYIYEKLDLQKLKYVYFENFEKAIGMENKRYL